MDGQMPPRTLSGAQEEQARKASDYRTNGNYTAAIKEYKNLAQALLSEARNDPDRRIDLLGLRCHIGRCLCEPNRIRSDENEASEAESYIRVTLAEWEKAEGEHCARGIAFTKAELGIFLVWQAEQFEAKEEEFFESEGQDALYFLKEAWTFYERATGSPDDNLQAESVLLSLSKATSMLELYEHTEVFSQEGLKRYGDVPRNAPFARKLQFLVLKLNLARSLLERPCRPKFQEAKEMFQETLSWLCDMKEPGLQDSVQDCRNLIRRCVWKQQWRKACLISQVAARLVTAGRKKKRCQNNWRIVYCTWKFIMQYRRLRHCRARQRWRKLMVAIKVVARLLVTGKKRSLCCKNWGIVHYVSILLIRFKRLRKLRTRRRWRRAILIVEATARLVVISRKSRQCRDNWGVVYCASILVIRLQKLRRKRRVRQRWKEAVASIVTTIRVKKAIRFAHQIRERRAATRNRWWKVLTMAKMTARFKVTFIRGLERRAKIEKQWRHFFILAKTIARFKCNLIRRAERKAAIQRRWRKIWSFAKTIALISLALSRRVECKRRWAVALSHSKQQAHVVIKRQRRRLDLWNSAIVHAQKSRLVVERAERVKRNRGIFFGTRSSKRNKSFNEEDREESDEWLKSYAGFCEHLADNSKAQSEYHPVKVAIIDTGIDITNTFIRKRWPPLGRTQEELLELDENAKSALRESRIKKCYKDFLDQPSRPEDKDGHGTHIAGLILRYAPNAHLHVARIAETKSSCMNDTEFERRVVNAIAYALREWKVDIISLSFAVSGMDLEQEMDTLINQANDNEFNKKPKSRTIILAAACNEGGRESVPYPANHPLVFSIRALTGYSKEAQFSPHPSEYDTNFSILGSHVLSTWPNHLCGSETIDSHDTDGPELREFGDVKCVTQYMSGTSFAAPLAAALIANVFAYYIEHKKEIVPESIPEDSYHYQLQRFTQVKKLMLAMSVKENKVNSLSPWRETNKLFAMVPRPRSIQELNGSITWILESWNK